MIKKLLFSIVLISSFATSSATILANVDRSSVAMGQSFTLSIQLPQTNNATPDLGQLAQDFTIYNTSRSTETNIVNGQSTTSSTLSLTLMPKQLGKQEIPAISIGNDATMPIAIEVVASQAQSGSNSDMYLEVASAKPNSQLYVGVPFIYSLKLYYSISLDNLNMQPISITTASISTFGKSLHYQSNQNGKIYQVLEQKFLITPNKSGTLSIPPVQVSGLTSDNNNNLFDFSQPKPFTLASKALTLEVNATPQALNGGSGIIANDLQGVQTWSQESNSIQVGQPITRTITLQAKGIQSSAIPDLSFNKALDNVNIYPDKTISKDSSAGAELVSSKTFKLAYIPTKDGQLTIPAILISWWNLNSKSLETIEIPAKTYKITPAANSNDSKAQLTPTSYIPQYVANNLKANNANQQSNIANNHHKIWYYLTILFALLWLTTLALTIWLYTRYKRAKLFNSSTTKEPDGSKESVNQQYLRRQIYKACNTQDLVQLNQALLAWAKAHWQHREIYSIMGIIDLVDNLALKTALKQINSAVYAGKEFNDYKLIEQQIRNIAASEVKTVKKGKTLPEFYPD